MVSDREILVKIKRGMINGSPARLISCYMAHLSFPPHFQRWERVF